MNNKDYETDSTFDIEKYLKYSDSIEIDVSDGQTNSGWKSPNEAFKQMNDDYEVSLSTKE